MKEGHTHILSRLNKGYLGHVVADAHRRRPALGPVAAAGSDFSAPGNGQNMDAASLPEPDYHPVNELNSNIPPVSASADESYKPFDMASDSKPKYLAKAAESSSPKTHHEEEPSHYSLEPTKIIKVTRQDTVESGQKPAHHLLPTDADPGPEIYKISRRTVDNGRSEVISTSRQSGISVEVDTLATSRPSLEENQQPNNATPSDQKGAESKPKSRRTATEDVSIPQKTGSGEKPQAFARSFPGNPAVSRTGKGMSRNNKSDRQFVPTLHIGTVDVQVVTDDPQPIQVSQPAPQLKVYQGSNRASRLYQRRL